MAKSRFASIQDPNSPEAVQLSLLATPGHLPYIKDPFPEILKGDENAIRCIDEAGPLLGVDWEFNPTTKKPTILGVANMQYAVAIPWSKRVAAHILAKADLGVKLVAHNGLGATSDKAILDYDMGVTTPIDYWIDTMIQFYRCHQDFAKSSDKEDDDSGSIGLMNLWSMASFHTSLPNWKYCVTGGSKVVIENGKAVNISALVCSQYAGKVLSYCEATGKMEWKTVVGWYKNARNARRLYRISYKHATRKVAATVTEDHPLLTDKGWLSVDGLTGQERICTGTPGLSEKQFSGVLGMVLGDGHIDARNSRLHVFNTQPQEEYLRYKLQLLQNLGPAHVTTKTYDAAKPNCKPLLHWKSSAAPVWKEFASNWQEQRQDLWEQFTLLSLAIWYMDDGYCSKDQRAEIAVSSHSGILLNLLLGKLGNWNMFPRLRQTNNGAKRLEFNVVESRKLFSLIGNYVPSCMRYKLGKYEGAYPLFDPSMYIAAPAVFWDYLQVVRVEDSCKTVYCLDVEDNHNFVLANVGVVHNCRGLACVGPCPHHKVYGYCAVDAWAGLAGHHDMNKWMAARNIPWSVYEHTAQVTELCGKMTAKGVCIDRKQVKKLEEANLAKKDNLFPFEMVGKKKAYTGPFNPNSGPQVIEYFEKHNIRLESTDKGAILAELKIKAKEKKWLLKELNIEGVGKDTYLVRGGDEIVEDSDIAEGLLNLYHLFQFKNAGKGGTAWFNDKYFTGNDDHIHPRFIPTGSSMGRLSSSRPNFMNIPRLGSWGKEVRKAIISSDDSLQITKADYSQLELRVCLWYAGARMDDGVDFFAQLVSHKPDEFQRALSISAFTKLRDISKSVVHACDYGEGFMAMTAEELGTERRRKERQVGALLVFDGRGDLPRWEYCGRFVCFTGANLAERLFGAKTFEYRAQALALQEVYMSFVPQIRTWHMSITKEIEQNNAVRSAFGSYLELYGTVDENFKMGTAFKGQGGGAQLAQEKMLLCPDIPILNVHDEFVVEQPRSRPPAQIRDYFRFMETESESMPGLSCPVKVSYGDTWGTTKEIE